MMIKQVLLLLAFASGLTLSVSESKSAPLLPQAADQSFTVGYIQMKNAANCSYLVVINTSCSSPPFTTDEISIVFGDGYGNQIYAPNLENPIAKTFERCSSDTFQIDGACASHICFAYLYRSGSDDGWKPESVKVYGFDTNGVTFNFNTSIPKDTWYGYNLCDTPSAPPPPPPPHPHAPPPPHPHPHPPTPETPPPPTPTTPPPPLPPSSSYQLFTPKWVIYVVLGIVCILWV